MSISRRNFLLSVASVGALISWPGSVWAKAKAKGKFILMMGDGEHKKDEMFWARPLRGAKSEGAALAYDMSHLSAEPISFELSFLPHSFVLSPQQPDTVFAIERWGRNYAVLDLKSKSVVQSLQVPEGRRLFGYASKNKSQMFFSVMNDKDGQGEVAVVTSKGEIESYIPSGGTYPHTCLWDVAADQLIVLNARSKVATTLKEKYGENNDHSSLTWIDTKSRTIAKQTFMKNQSGGYCHIHADGAGSYFVSGLEYDMGMAPRPLVSLVGPDGQQRDFLFPAVHAVKGEALSLALSPSGLLAASLPMSNQVHFWQMRSGIHKGAKTIKEPRAMIWSDAHKSFLVSSAGDRQFYTLHKDGDKIATGSVGRAGRGSHAQLIN